MTTPTQETFTIVGDPGRIRESAYAHLRLAARARLATDLLSRVERAEWDGDEATAFASRRAALRPALDGAGPSYEEVARALFEFAEAVAHARRRMALLEAEHAALTGRVVPPSTLALVPPLGLAGAVAAEAARATGVVDAVVWPLEQEARRLRRGVEEAAASCAARVARVTTPPRAPRPTTQPTLWTPLTPEPPATPPDLESWSVERQRRWWASLSPAQKQACVDRDPQRWGNLPGVPAVERDRINRVTHARVEADGKEWFRDAGVPLPTTGEGFQQLSPTDLVRLGVIRAQHLPDGTEKVTYDARAMARLEQVAGAVAIREQTALSTREDPVLLTDYEPGLFDGRGRVVMSLGDPETADETAVVISGFRSKAGALAGPMGDVRALRNEARKVDPTRTTAVVLWQGYDAPQAPLLEGRGLWRATSNADVAREAKADAGARRLAVDVAHLDEARGARHKVTTIGYSFGSVVTGVALQRYGLAPHVGKAVFVGSPGPGGDARRAEDLHLRRDQVFVASASRDPVTTVFAGHGADPATEGFGAIRTKAESPTRDDAPFWDPDDHCKYFAAPEGRPSESLRSLAVISAGHPERLADEGLIAEHRSRGFWDPRPSLAPNDPEYDRTP